jgi:CBS domain-containing protein
MEKDMHVGLLLEKRDRQVISCQDGTTVREAVAVLAAERIGALPVMAGGEVAGIFSERDLLRLVHQGGSDMLDRPVCDVMTAPAITITPDMPVLHALSLMTQRRVRHLPVVSEGRMVGFVSIGDLVKARIDAIESEAEALRSYIQMA